MARANMVLPPLWRLEELFKLSNEYHSGLEWKIAKAGYKPGDEAGRLNKKTGFYMVSVDNKVYLAHRIVHYMRTHEEIDSFVIRHDPSNSTKDNRLPLICVPNKKKRTVKADG
jgi:hypothetical protein